MRTQALRIAVSSVVLTCASTCGANAGSRAAAPVPLDAGLTPCPGGFTLPGSATCVRLSGAVEAEGTVQMGGHGARGSQAGGSIFRERTHARIAVDVRTPTELGPLRVYTSVRVASPPEPDVLRR